MTSTELNDFNENLIREFRANEGKVTGVFEQAPLLLLTTPSASASSAPKRP
jgi:hypothetical protein